MRAFIAIEIPQIFRDPLQAVSDELQAKLDGKSIRWLPVENVHLTLKFLKQLSEEDIVSVTESIQKELVDVVPFELKLGGLGIYPNPQMPRVIWFGVETGPELIELQQRVERVMVALGYPSERRPFTPHLTLGRVRRNVHDPLLTKIRDVIKREKPAFRPRLRVEQTAAFRSELKSSGAVYTKLFDVQLGKRQEETHSI